MRLSGKNLSNYQKTLLALAAIGALGALVWLRAPLLYEAHTTLLIVPGQLPAPFDTTARVEMVRQVVLSDKHLEGVIDQFHLYPNLAGHSTKDEILARLRESIRIEASPAAQPRVVRIAFLHRDPAVAAKVANRLAALMVQEDNGLRDQQAESSTGFLDARVDLVHKMLMEAEDRLRNAKGAPAAEIAVASRELDVLTHNFTKLLDMKMDADMAAARAKDRGESFMILDPARIPEKPVSRVLRAGLD